MNSKTVASSRTVMTELVMPNDTNPLGDLMGGNLMRWMDIAAGICAARHCEAHAVTASVDHVSFRRPIHLGNVLTITASVTCAFNTSIEIFIKVATGNVTQGDMHVSNHAYMTFVALDPYTHKPKTVPKVKPETEQEIKLCDGAARRRELRLMLAGRMEVKDAVEIKAMFLETED
ncbi:MAG: acyl-CoA thioesterase [Bacteroidetes bacterium]|nr:MAG: acyl-CoA thioesterase [Bacteroidota bacterium]